MCSTFLLPIINPHASYNLFTQLGGLLGHSLLASGHVFIALLIFLPRFSKITVFSTFQLPVWQQEYQLIEDPLWHKATLIMLTMLWAQIYSGSMTHLQCCPERPWHQVRQQITNV